MRKRKKRREENGQKHGWSNQIAKEAHGWGEKTIAVFWESRNYRGLGDWISNGRVKTWNCVRRTNCPLKPCTNICHARVGARSQSFRELSKSPCEGRTTLTILRKNILEKMRGVESSDVIGECSTEFLGHKIWPEHWQYFQVINHPWVTFQESKERGKMEISAKSPRDSRPLQWERERIV